MTVLALRAGNRSRGLAAASAALAILTVGAALGSFFFAGPPPEGSGEYEMMTYYVAFLKRGPAWTPEQTDETRKIQEAHLAHIGAMAESGDLVLAGPFMDDGDLRGMFVFKVDTLEKAEALAQADPAVKAGRLRLEFHPWYSAKGITIVKPEK